MNSESKSEKEPRTTDKTRNPKYIKAMSLVAASIMFLSGCSADKAAAQGSPNTPIPTQAGEAAPTYTENPLATATETGQPTAVEALPTVPSVESLEIAAGETPEKTVQDIVSRLNELSTIGQTKDVYEAWYQDSVNSNFTNDSTEWPKTFAAPYIKSYLSALCGDEYASNPNIATLVKEFGTVAASHLDIYLRTVQDPRLHANVGGKPVYQYNISYTKLISSSPNSYTFTVHEKDNLSDTSIVAGSSIDDQYNITCNTRVDKDADGKDVVHIIGYNSVTLPSASSN